MSTPHTPGPEPGPRPTPDGDPFGPPPDADPGFDPRATPDMDASDPSILDRVRARLDARREGKLAELEDVQQAYANAGAIALGETIDPDAKVVPHIEADRRVMRPIHRRRERDIAEHARDHAEHTETLDTLATYAKGQAKGMEAAHAGRTGYKDGRVLSEAERLKEAAEGAKTKSQTKEQKQDLLWEVRSEADDVIDAFRTGDTSQLSPEGLRVFNKLDAARRSDPTTDTSNDTVTLAILYERSSDPTNFDRSRNIAGEYVRGLTDKEVRQETRDLKAQYKRGEISRVQYENAVKGLPTKKIIEIPDEQPRFGYGKGFVKRTGKKQRKAERRIERVTDTGAAARLRQARIAHLRDKLGYEQTPFEPEYAEPEEPIATPETPVLGPEELHREEIRTLLRHAGVSASVRTALHDIPLDFIPNKSRAGNDNIGDSEFARMLTEASTTEPSVLKEALDKGYPELVTIMGEHGDTYKMGALDPDSPKAGEPMVVIRYETTNLGDRTDEAAARKYPYQVAGQPFVDFRAHLFVPQSDAKRLVAMITANPAEARNIIDVAMQEKLGAKQSWESYEGGRVPTYREYVARPPYAQWDRINGGRPKIAVRRLK